MIKNFSEKLIFLPFFLLIVSISVLTFNYLIKKEVVELDVDLKGGTLITVETSKEIDVNLVNEELEKFGSFFISQLRTSKGYALKIEIEESVDAEEVVNNLKEKFEIYSFSIETTSSILGKFLSNQIFYIFMASFSLMSLIIFLSYKKIFTSFTILFATFSNILTTLAFSSILGIKLSLAGFAGLLMLIGYSIDTNILLVTKSVNLSKEIFKEKYRQILKTGLTLFSTIFFTMLIVIFLSNSKLLVNIAQFLIIGFLADLAYTWIFNAKMIERLLK